MQPCKPSAVWFFTFTSKESPGARLLKPQRHKKVFERRTSTDAGRPCSYTDDDRRNVTVQGHQRPYNLARKAGQNPEESAAIDPERGRDTKVSCWERTPQAAKEIAQAS